jgi:hypothetical protein
VKEAMSVFPSPGPAAARHARQAQLKALPLSARATWDRLDKAFFAYPDDLRSLMRAFVTAHAADFR